MGTALPGRKRPGFPELEALSKVYSSPRAIQTLPSSSSPAQPHCSQRCWTKSSWVLQPGSELCLFSRGNIWQLSWLDCLVFPKNLRGLSTAPVMTRGVTGQRDEGHFRSFAGDLCQKAKKVLLAIPGASPVLCCQAGFYWGHSCLSNRIFNCFFPFTNVFTAMGTTGHRPGLLEPVLGSKMSIPHFLQPRSTGESRQLPVTCRGKAQSAFQREKGRVPLGWLGGAQPAEQCWPLLASKASPLPPIPKMWGCRGPTWMLGAGEDCLEGISGVEAPAGPRVQVKVEGRQAGHF